MSFDRSALIRVLQTREGDATTPNGYSDVGTFLLGTAGLKAAWDGYLAAVLRGAGTGREVHFRLSCPFSSAYGAGPSRRSPRWPTPPRQRHQHKRRSELLPKPVLKERPMKKILVTGGAGFIGSHLCEGLQTWATPVRVLQFPA